MVDDAAGKIAPANKEMFLGMCRAEGEVEQFKKFVEAAPVIRRCQCGEDHRRATGGPEH